MKQLVYISLLSLCFLLGATIWYFTHSITSVDKKLKTKKTKTAGILVYVNDQPIMVEDIDWEYSLLTKDIFSSEEFLSMPNFDDKFEEQLEPLKEKLLMDMIARKVLYFAIKEDKSFDSTDPSLYQECIAEWQKLIKEVSFFEDQSSQNKLKVRLCEKSLIEKYANARIFNDIQVTKNEIQQYYDTHLSEFKKPEQVIIRQIVLATEKDLNNIKNLVNRNNFAEMAKTYSIAPEGKNGGLLGPFAKGEFPEIFDIAFQLKKGEIKYGIKSNYGFHIIMLENKIPAHTLGLNAVYNKIEEKLKQQYKEERYQQWLNQALNVVKVRVPPLITLH